MIPLREEGVSEKFNAELRTLEIQLRDREHRIGAFKEDLI